MKIIFRVDASLQIGCGHVYRCLTLADKLTEFGCQVEFISTEHPGNLNNFITEKGYQVHRLPNSNEKQECASWLGRDWQEDAQLTLHILSESELDWLIVDHYAIDSRWHEAVQRLEYKLMVIDDLADREYSCDRLLDQTFERSVQDYLPHLTSEAELFLGTEFGLLRDEFALASEQALILRKQHVKINSILLSLGGTDVDNITGKVIAMLEVTQLSDLTRFNVIVGPNNPNLSALETVVEQSRFQCKLHTSVTNMADLIMESDIAIGAAGSSAWERCVLSLPSLSITLADNQRTVAQRLAEQGVAISLGKPEELTPGSLDSAIAECEANYQNMVTKAGRLLDGMGASRVAISLFTTVGSRGEEIYLKRASWQDCERLFEWQQAPETRRFALVSAVPSWQEHCEWFSNKVIDHKSFLFIIRRKKTDVGMVRLDPMKENDFYQISIFTAPDCFRQGVAKSALELIRLAFKSITIFATVLPENFASKSLFKSMGYMQVDKSQWVQYPLEEANE
ncbi:UDP-2,4-diacetamido-2,4,6-trideoxy-beta-L-altropyranose hydrolase [uncultured Shewanella sp.]|uniref:UDP-2,4-diacetamido-2,4, 6-trideoxy-beta-L-altropyranose hydrolase n=1 Tax=Shewanella atlantica TaxID=271099 RepID=UPI002613CCF6|nr:UDP-2,4-diacetamido-2,4,6-trideoxy-beta-L-altropyranose hydrolase [uncultured Shewanella sp.]